MDSHRGVDPALPADRGRFRACGMSNFHCLFTDEMARAVVEGRKAITRRPGVNLPPPYMGATPEVVDGVLRNALISKARRAAEV